MLSMVYFGVSTTMYGVTLWLPSVIRSFSGLSYFWTGAIAVLPFLIAVVVMVLVGIRSDRTGERRWHTAIPAFTAAAGMVIAAYGSSTLVVVTGLALGMAFAEAMCRSLLGDGDVANAGTLRGGWNRSHQLAGQSRRLLWTRYHWEISHREWRISKGSAGNRGNGRRERNRRPDCGSRGPFAAAGRSLTTMDTKYSEEKN